MKALVSHLSEKAVIAGVLHLIATIILLAVIYHQMKL